MVEWAVEAGVGKDDRSRTPMLQVQSLLRYLARIAEHRRSAEGSEVVTEDQLNGQPVRTTRPASQKVVNERR